MRVASIARYLRAGICLLCAFSAQAYAPGDVDASFNAGAANSRVLGAVTQPDNKIVIVGAFNAVGYTVGEVIALTDGQLRALIVMALSIVHLILAMHLTGMLTQLRCNLMEKLLLADGLRCTTQQW